MRNKAHAFWCGFVAAIIAVILLTLVHLPELNHRVALLGLLMFGMGAGIMVAKAFNNEEGD